MSIANPKAYRDPWEDELDLRELIRVIVKRRGLIFGLIAVSVAVAALMSFFVLPSVYESEATLQLPTRSAEISGEYSPEALAAIGTSPTVLGQLADRLPSAADQGLERAVSVSLDAPARLLRVRAEARTAEDANVLLATWTEVFIRTVNDSLTQMARDRLVFAEAELAARRDELEAARDALRSFEAAYSVAILQAELESLEAELLRANERIRELELYSLPADRERLAYLQAQLGQHPQTLGVESSIPADFIPGYESDPPAAGGTVINPTFLHIQQALVETSERLAINTGLLERLRVFVGEAPAQIDLLRAELAQLQSEAERLKEALHSAQARYEAAENEHARALKGVAASTQDGPRIVSEPTFPTSPVRPRKMLNIALAAFLAAFVGIGITFTLEIWQSDYRREGV